MGRFIVNKLTRATICHSFLIWEHTPPEPVSTAIDADYFEVNSNGDLIFYKRNKEGLPLPYQPVVAFASGNWLTVDDQSLSEDKNEVS